ncbi:MAG: protease complex subunit PrcB family protein [Candidatus Obscuribacterales bacterium]|nr:protease complex subunit PrcB family protein [Candidatus Obscuribacterales bacterium]
MENSIIGLPIHRKWTLVAQGENSGIKDKRLLCITGEAEWQEFWKEHTSWLVSAPPALPTVDIDREVVVAIFAGSYSSGGYAVSIEKVEDYEQTVAVTYKVIGKGAETEAMTQPFIMVRLSTGGREVSFNQAA